MLVKIKNKVEEDFRFFWKRAERAIHQRTTLSFMSVYSAETFNILTVPIGNYVLLWYPLQRARKLQRMKNFSLTASS